MYHIHTTCYNSQSLKKLADVVSRLGCIALPTKWTHNFALISPIQADINVLPYIRAISEK